MMIVQIVMNNLLKHYGAQSVYGESIPIACAGIVMKVNQLYFSIIIGLSQGSQPIESFNYGAKQYKRVKDAFLLAASVGAVVSIIPFCCSSFSRDRSLVCSEAEAKNILSSVSTISEPSCSSPG